MFASSILMLAIISTAGINLKISKHQVRKTIKFIRKSVSNAMKTTARQLSLQL